MITTIRKAETPLSKIMNSNVSSAYDDDAYSFIEPQAVRAKAAERLFSTSVPDASVNKSASKDNDVAVEYNKNISKNFEALLNLGKQNEVYEQQTMEMTDFAESSSASATEERPVERTYDLDDIEPTTTTMQFQSEEAEEIQKDVVDSKKESSFSLNMKGKIAIMLYSLVLLVVFTLIILNTRMLSSLSNSITDKEAYLATLKQQAVTLNENLDYVSADEVIIVKAEGFGMTK